MGTRFNFELMSFSIVGRQDRLVCVWIPYPGVIAIWKRKEEATAATGSATVISKRRQRKESGCEWAHISRREKAQSVP